MTVRYDVNDQVAFVTAASSGMGRAEAGASTVLVDYDTQTLEAFSEELKAEGFDVLAVDADVTDEAQVAEAVATAVSTYGRLEMSAWAVNCSRNNHSRGARLRITEPSISSGCRARGGPGSGCCLPAEPTRAPSAH
jgi:NAD(P)-dependent dehydrogenase (short-subunit alcohol dehydrogenase family)